MSAPPGRAFRGARLRARVDVTAPPRASAARGSAMSRSPSPPPPTTPNIWTARSSKDSALWNNISPDSSSIAMQPKAHMSICGPKSMSPKSTCERAHARARTSTLIQEFTRAKTLLLVHTRGLTRTQDDRRLTRELTRHLRGCIRRPTYLCGKSRRWTPSSAVAHLDPYRQPTPRFL